MQSDSESSLAPVLYLSHGGGPLPLLGDPAHQELINCLEHVVTLFTKPAAILVISAHWEAEVATIGSGEQPPLIYDYYGFPQEAYEIDYAAKGAPALAQKISALLNQSGIEAVLDEARGFDHGMFVTLKIMYPHADIPCVQLSLLKSMDPQQHIRLGNALADLRKENVLVIGSGSSFHNLKYFLSPSNDEGQRMNESFEQWLLTLCCDRELDEGKRADRLVHWQDAPGARHCHPREEHLLPLHVCYGMTRTAAKEIFKVDLMGKKISCYLW